MRFFVKKLCNTSFLFYLHTDQLNIVIVKYVEFLTIFVIELSNLASLDPKTEVPAIREILGAEFRGHAFSVQNMRTRLKCIVPRENGHYLRRSPHDDGT